MNKNTDSISKSTLLNILFKLKQKLNYYILYTTSQSFLVLFNDDLSIIESYIALVSDIKDKFVYYEDVPNILDVIVDVIYDIGYYKLEIYKKISNDIPIRKPLKTP